MQKSSDYKFYSFDSDNSILYHEVTNENFGNKELFITSMAYLTTLIERHRPKYLFIKIMKKPEFFEFLLKDFMQKTLYTTLINSGTLKIALYIFDERYLDILKKHEINTVIKARFFTDIDTAKQWLLNPTA